MSDAPCDHDPDSRLHQTHTITPNEPITLYLRLFNSSPQPLTPEQRWSIYSREQRQLMGATRLPAGKYSGRSVEVSEFQNVSSALGRLNRILSQNRVKKELRLEERYEKPNAKRRRLKSERHRRRFAEMVSLACIAVFLLECLRQLSFLFYSLHNFHILFAPFPNCD